MRYYAHVICSRARISLPRLLSRPLCALAASALLMSVVLLGGGCAPEGGQGKPFVLTGEGTEDATWPFWPRAMRVHPLTRFTDDPRADDRVLLEVRVEFTDAWNDPCKALGVLRLELHDRANTNHFDRERDHYSIDLRELEINVVRWDPVTRTYVTKLEVARERIPQQPFLIAHFQAADGAEATDRIDVRAYQQPNE